MPLRSLNPTSAKSCVPDRRPLGYVKEYAPKAFSGLRLALHHFSNFLNNGIKPKTVATGGISPHLSRYLLSVSEASPAPVFARGFAVASKTGAASK